MEKTTGVDLYNKVLSLSMQIPNVKVNREEFLYNAFSDFCTEQELEQIIKENPRAVLNLDLIDTVAENVISTARNKVSIISTLTGIPGNPIASVGLGITDLAQYYGFCINVCQKLAYLYGYPDLMKNGELSPHSLDVITPMLGVMFGVKSASKVLADVTKRIAIQVAKRIPVMTFGHAAWYMLIKQISKWIGIRMSKQLFAKSISKTIPILGGLISGGLSYVTFGPMANKLAKKLRIDSKVFVNIQETEENTNDAESIKTNHNS